MDSMSNTPLITDWIMVVITTIYVLATICIWFANKKAADASRAQLEESRRQFDEMNRISVMPYLKLGYRQGSSGLLNFYIDLYDSSRPERQELYPVVLSNVGNGNAIDIECRLVNNDGKCEDRFPTLALQKEASEPINLYFKYPAIAIKDEHDTVSLLFTYNDVLGNQYSQLVSFEMRFNNHSHIMKVTCMNMEPPNRTKI